MHVQAPRLKTVAPTLCGFLTPVPPRESLWLLERVRGYEMTENKMFESLAFDLLFPHASDILENVFTAAMEKAEKPDAPIEPTAIIGDDLWEQLKDSIEEAGNAYSSSFEREYISEEQNFNILNLCVENVNRFIDVASIIIGYGDKISDIKAHSSKTNTQNLINNLTRFWSDNAPLRERPSYIPPWQLNLYPNDADCLILFLALSGALLPDESTQTSPAFPRNGIEFEKKCLDALESLGFCVEETPVSGDFGADLLASRNTLKFCIQCKDHITPIGVGAIQESYSAMEFYDSDYAVVVCSSSFTPAALKMADKLGVICLNFDHIEKLMDRVQCGR